MSNKNPNFAPCSVHVYEKLVNTKNQCPLYNRGIHRLCGKGATKPVQPDNEIIKYYILTYCEGLGGGKKMDTKVY